MNKEQLKALLDANKISAEAYAELCTLVDMGKQLTEKDIELVVAKVAQAEDEKKQLEAQRIADGEAVAFADFKYQLCNEEIIGKSLSDDELKAIWKKNNKDVKSAVIEAINTWATKEAKEAGILGKDAVAFRNNGKIGKKVMELQTKVLNALGITELKLQNLPNARILVDILVNDATHNVYEGTMGALMNPFDFVQVGEGINKVKQLEIGMELDDGNIIPTSRQIEESKSAKFSYNVEFKLADEKFKSYVSVTDGDYVKYFKSSADLVGFIQNTIGKIKRAIFFFQYSLMHRAYNEVFQALYAKATDGTTNHIVSSKVNMLDALGEYKEIKEEIKQFQSTKYAIEDSNMPYAPSVSEFVYVAPLKAKTNIEKFAGTALTGDSTNKLVGNIVYIPDTYYDPIQKSIVNASVFTDSEGTIHNNCILAVEKDAFVGMYNLDVDTSADFPFGLTRVYVDFWRGNVEIDKTCKAFLFEADALLQDFTVPTTQKNEARYVAPLTESARKGGKKGK